MTLVIETGAGLADANSWATVEQLEAYAASRGVSINGDTAAKEARLILAADYLRNEQRYRYRGVRQSVTQRLPFPRNQLSERDGPDYPDGAIPWRLIDAQCELAMLAQSRTLQGVLSRGGDIRSVKVDVIAVEFGDKALVEDLFQSVAGLLAPLLRDEYPDHPEPYARLVSQPEGAPYPV